MNNVPKPGSKVVDFDKSPFGLSGLQSILTFAVIQAAGSLDSIAPAALQQQAST